MAPLANGSSAQRLPHNKSVGSQSESEPERKTVEGDLPEGYYSPRQLAELFGIPDKKFNRLEKALKKFRDKNLLGVGFIEHDAPAKNMPRFFYSLKEVRPIALRYVPAPSKGNSDEIQTD
jgi:hypothetical protein